jgi:hypothetical protein
MEELTTLLRRERWLVGILLFRLTELHHLQVADDARFLTWATAEVNDAVARVREAELLRLALMDGLVVEPDAAFAEHCDALRELLIEVRFLSDKASFPTLDDFISQLVA